MANLASQADLWYNEAVNIVVSEGAGNTAQTLINLYRRSIVNTLPPHANNGNTPEKRCKTCKNSFPATVEFFHRDSGGKYGLQGRCKSCVKEYDAPRCRSRNLKRCYSLSEKEYQEIFDAQQGVCAICGNPETARNQYSTRRLNVDHCHITGAIRGLLCSECNTVLGKMKEDPERVKAFLRYIEERCLW